jgi:hypothetical protein
VVLFLAAPNPPKAYTTTVEVEESDGEMNEIMSLKLRPPDYARDKVGSLLTLGHNPFIFPDNHESGLQNRFVSQLQLYMLRVTVDLDRKGEMLPMQSNI